MANISSQRNIGSLISVRAASSQVAVTAAGTGDNTTKTGIAFDRTGFGNEETPESAVFAVLFDATLASGATISASFAVQDSADGTTYADYATVATAVAGTGPSGGGAVSGAISFAVDLTGARRYVRSNFIPDLSAAGTDTATVRGVAIFAGWDQVPAP